MESTRKRKYSIASAKPAGRPPLLAILIVGFLSVVFVSAWQWLKSPGVLPITEVVVSGKLVHTDPVVLKQQLSAQISGGFFAVDVQQLRRAAEAIPWVDSAIIRRVWPDKIEVQIKEHQALATWRGGALVSRTGRLFYPGVDSVPAGLPQLTGPKGLHAMVVQQFKAICLRFVEKGLVVQSLVLDDRWAWKLKLEGGTQIILGKKIQPHALDRFLKSYQLVLRDAGRQIAMIDLRYTNGFAVRWKKGAVTTLKTLANG